MSDKSRKPKFLFHGSPSKNLKLLKPMNLSVRDSSEGKVIFAAEDKKHVSVFIVPSDDSWSHLCAFSYGSEGPEGKLVRNQYAIYTDRERFEKLDTGGAIYKVPSESFYLDSGYGDKEWTSREQVKPVSKKVFNSGLDAMLHYGVKVCFVDLETLKKIKSAEDHGYSIVTGLKAETTNK